MIRAGVGITEYLSNKVNFGNAKRLANIIRNYR